MRRIVRFLTVVCAMALGALPLAVSGGSAQAALTVPATVSASNWTTMSNTEGTSPSSDSYLGSVSCVTSVFCLAVGSNDVFSDPTYFAEQWNGSTWSPIALPTPAGAAELELDQVSCVTTSFCVAVGQAYFSGTQTPLILQWNGSGFVVVLGATAASSAATLGAVSCLNASLCYAAGSTGTDLDQALVEQWNGSSWSASTPVPPATGITEIQILGMSCGSTSTCMVVGQAESGSPTVTYSLQLTGGVWYGVVTPSPSGVDSAQLASVSCVGASFCTAVGSTELSGTPEFENLIETWNGTSWTLLPLTPSTPPTYASFLGGVSCFSATSCTAVGGMWTNSTPNISTVVLNWDGQSWTVANSRTRRGPSRRR